MTDARPGKWQIVAPSENLLRVFQGIIEGLEQFIEKEGYYGGTLLKSISISEEGEVKLTTPLTFPEEDQFLALRNDLIQFIDLVVLAASRFPGMGYPRPSVIFLFDELVSRYINRCQTVDELKELWFFMRTNPLFYNSEKRYYFVRKTFTMLKMQYGIIRRISLIGRWTDMIDSHIAVRGEQQLYKILVHGTEDGSTDPMYLGPWAALIFQRNAYEHLLGIGWNFLQIEELLFRNMPEFVLKYFFEMGANFYDVNLNYVSVRCLRALNYPPYPLGH
ncbi:uncharacterized protein LOC132307169 isoform X2 [Cornus florida]|uniref:uncharacterized protein LOC132307169 isoform X2 n=1 Tax=Cornus florida TaxID=4283 RepID=UPI0028965CDD|nr:uncharacterized protein LOC132307169 isoform X2 [Cornus florida]